MKYRKHPQRYLSDEQAKYERWWLKKRVRRRYSEQPHKLVVKLTAIGPPSGFNCVVELFYEDGSRDIIGPGVTGFKPNKTAMEIENAQPLSPPPK